MKNFLQLFFCILLLFCAQNIFAQNRLFKDSVYLSIQKIKPDSVRTDRALDYLGKLILKKSPVSEDLKEALLKQARLQKDSLTVGRIYGSSGFSYLSLGEFDHAYEQYFTALPLIQKYGKPKQVVRMYQDLMWIQFQLRDYSTAQTSLTSALSIAKANNIKDKEAEVYNMFGILYDNQFQYEKAITYYKQALAVNKKYGTKFNEISSLVNLAVSERRMKSFPSSLKDLYQAKKISDSIKNDYYLQAILQNIGEVAFDMKDYDTAEKYMIEAYKNSKNNTEPILRTGLLAMLKNIYKQKGDYKSALMYSDSLAKINDDIFKKEKVAQTRDIETKYETRIKDAQLVRQGLLSLQQDQELELKKKQLQLSGKENEILALAFLERQAQLQNEKLTQASSQEKQALLFQLNTRNKNKQIAIQKEAINTGEDFKIFLFVTLGLVAFIAAFAFYNNARSKKFARIISVQKRELELSGQVKDRIFSVVSHDMRAPINTLIAFTQLLEYGEISPDNLAKYAAELKKSLNHTSVLMENLLNWSSSQMQGFKPVLEMFDINFAVAEVINSLQTQAVLKGIVIENHISSGTLVLADSNMMQLVLRNLISNAIKYSHKDGQVILSAESNGGEVNIYVKDSGTGMSEKNVHQFNTSNYLQFIESTPGTNKEKGTGLGLVLCKNFTTLMNGEIYVTSEKNKGSLFSVILPKAA